MYTLGIDIGSTTVKVAVLDKDNKILFSDYKRHFANIKETLKDLVQEAKDALGENEVNPCITGSGGLALAQLIGVPFTQEVVCVSEALQDYAPQTDVAIELGGEDAKIIYFTNGIEQRMNGVCAGGTGSFIDQMATLLQTDASGLNDYAKDYDTIYPIAARCGVFAKTDIQPLINEGATKPNLAASIFQAVVNQTISGLACGKPIKGNVAFLGGPLHFLPELKNAFIRTLNLTGDAIIDPGHSHLFAAVGAAMNSKPEVSMTLSELIHALSQELNLSSGVERLAPLFESDEDYEKFKADHNKYAVKRGDLATYKGNCFIGVDAGSTTTKVALVGSDGELLYDFYSSNNGSPLNTTIRAIKDIYSKLPEGAVIAGSCSTGYGEALIKQALSLDFGEVETIAHYTAAAFFDPEVDCILDIGGQDMKCLKIHNGAIDNIFLNEACSSGCGSFLQTFAEILGYTAEQFAQIGLKADMPVDLGSRCTVFMNSSVKQAQKDGASVANISAGLSISIVKNALYKVIRPASKEAIGKHIVVQGGTFLNDCVLRAFEQEMDLNVIRPNIAGLMGAYGAALYAQRRYKDAPHQTTLLNLQQLGEFVHTVKGMTCGLCNNHCHLTVNTFAGGKRFISGNRCERPITHMAPKDELNLYRQKLQLLKELPVNETPKRGIMGIPMGLNMYELLPFWNALLSSLGFKVVHSPIEDKNIYRLGQGTIPSDTVCYPAKLMHGHIKWLLQQGITNIFYPCMTYNIDEQGTENCYNCPVVAYYPEVLHANIRDLNKPEINFFYDYLGLLHKKKLVKKLQEMFAKAYPDITKDEIRKAVDAAFTAFYDYEAQVKAKGQEIISKAREEHKPIVVLAGRPYHIDPKVNHSIDRLITNMGAALVSEDAVSSHIKTKELNRDLQVLNQWTYHGRLYAAAEYVAQNPDMHLIQLVSFGCGCDAITADECRRLLEERGRIYTQIKIDDIDNLGAAKIRIRSLFSAAQLFDIDNN